MNSKPKFYSGIFCSASNFHPGIMKSQAKFRKKFKNFSEQGKRDAPAKSHLRLFHKWRIAVFYFNNVF